MKYSFSDYLPSSSTILKTACVAGIAFAICASFSGLGVIESYSLWRFDETQDLNRHQPKGMNPCRLVSELGERFQKSCQALVERAVFAMKNPSLVDFSVNITKLRECMHLAERRERVDVIMTQRGCPGGITVTN